MLVISRGRPVRRWWVNTFPSSCHWNLALKLLQVPPVAQGAVPGERVRRGRGRRRLCRGLFVSFACLSVGGLRRVLRTLFFPLLVPLLVPLLGAAMGRGQGKEGTKRTE